MKRVLTGAVLAAAVLAMAAAPASAQLSEGGGPISYSADDLQYFDDQRRLVLVGDVEIAQGEATLRSNRLTLFFAAGQGAQAGGVGSGDIDRIVAEGDVFYLRPDQTARGDRAVYVTQNETVTFTGNVIVATPENVIRGETLVLNIGSGRTTIKPGERPGQRVRGVFSAQQRAPR